MDRTFDIVLLHEQFPTPDRHQSTTPGEDASYVPLITGDSRVLMAANGKGWQGDINHYPWGKPKEEQLNPEPVISKPDILPPEFYDPTITSQTEVQQPDYGQKWKEATQKPAEATSAPEGPQLTPLARARLDPEIQKIIADMRAHEAAMPTTQKGLPTLDEIDRAAAPPSTDQQLSEAELVAELRRNRLAREAAQPDADAPENTVDRLAHMKPVMPDLLKDPRRYS